MASLIENTISLGCLENPCKIHQQALNTNHVTLWCALCLNGKILLMTKWGFNRTIHETFTVLYEFAPGRVISRFGYQNWPPRSYDLTPMDFWLQPYVKTQVYTNKLSATQALNAEIRRCVNEISPHAYNDIFANCDKEVHMCQQSWGGHLQEIVFHTKLWINKYFNTSLEKTYWTLKSCYIISFMPKSSFILQLHYFKFMTSFLFQTPITRLFLKL